jgi:hypothetical protein
LKNPASSLPDSYFIDQPNHQHSGGVKFLDFETGKATSVANPDGVCSNLERICNGLTVSPDGQAIAFGLAEPNGIEHHAAQTLPLKVSQLI